MKTISAFLLTAFLSLSAFAADAPVYDESADAQAQVSQALARAKADNKQVMIVFGANWCGDCKMLDGEFKKPALKTLLDANYVVVKVDVNRFNKNLDVVKPYGDVIKKGIPSIVIATPANQLVYATNGGELADARKMGETGVAEFFRELVARKGRI
jgi:thioredoxin 1